MKQWIENYLFTWINGICVLFTVVILLNNFLGISFDGKEIRIVFLATVIICSSEYLIFSMKAISIRGKWVIHYIWCFMVYALVLSLSGIMRSPLEWDLVSWVQSISWYTLGYVGVSYFYNLKRKKEEQKLNKQLIAFKKQYSKL